MCIRDRDKVRLRKKFAGIVGIPVFHVGEDSKHDSILVASICLLYTSRGV